MQAQEVILESGVWTKIVEPFLVNPRNSHIINKDKGET